MVTIGSNTVVHATCGAQYTMAVTARGRLYAWGDNSYGQLGLGVQKEEVVYNRRVTKCVQATAPYPPRVCAAAASLGLAADGCRTPSLAPSPRWWSR